MRKKQVHLLTAHHIMCLHFWHTTGTLTHKTCVFSKMKIKTFFCTKQVHLLQHHICLHFWHTTGTCDTQHVRHFQNVFWHEFIVFISQGFINILKVISTTFSLLRSHICATSRCVNLQVWIRSLYFHDMIYKLLLCFVSFYIVDGFSLKRSHS